MTENMEVDRDSMDEFIRETDEWIDGVLAQLCWTREHIVQVNAVEFCCYFFWMHTCR